jgi:hypothetical protein
MKYLVKVNYENVEWIIEAEDLQEAQKTALEEAYEFGYDIDEVYLEETD